MCGRLAPSWWAYQGRTGVAGGIAAMPSRTAVTATRSTGTASAVGPRLGHLAGQLPLQRSIGSDGLLPAMLMPGVRPWAV
jgi:hypothetical protein